jgi:hemerythrin
MAFIVWKGSLRVGVKEFDQQHQQLVLMLNCLHQAMSEGQGKAVLSGILTDIADYTVTHFKTEERYMQKYHYRDMSEHKGEHDQFVAKVATSKGNMIQAASSSTPNIPSPSRIGRSNTS